MRKRIELFRAIAVLILVFLVGGLAGAGTIHGVLIGDTADPAIGRAVERDLDAVAQFLSRAAASTSLQLSVARVDGVNLNPARVDQTLERIHVSPEDVLFLYLSGHGSSSGELVRYPRFDCGGETIDFAELLGTAYGKNPRLLVAFVDACNGNEQPMIGEKRHEWKKPALVAEPDRLTGPQADASELETRFRVLFAEAEGVFVASSSVPGQNSKVSGQGSVFTQRMLNVIERSVHASSWEETLKQVTKPLVVRGDRHDAQFDQLPKGLSSEQVAESLRDRRSRQVVTVPVDESGVRFVVTAHPGAVLTVIATPATLNTHTDPQIVISDRRGVVAASSHYYGTTPRVDLRCSRGVYTVDVSADEPCSVDILIVGADGVSLPDLPGRKTAVSERPLRVELPQALTVSDAGLVRERYADRYYVMAEAGVTLTVRVESPEFDTYLFLVDAMDDVLSNDDAHSTTDSSLTYVPTVSGLLEILVTSYDTHETGYYRVIVGRENPPQGRPPE